MAHFSKPKSIVFAFQALIVSSALGGCSMDAWFGTGPAPKESASSDDASGVSNANEGRAALATHESATVETAAAETTSVSKVGGLTEVSGVEVVWQVPLKPVEVYHLNYGFDSANLNQELTIPVDKLEKIDHPSYGPVFKYRLKGVPNNRDVFVTLRAENRIGLSDPSPVIKVAATAKSDERGASASTVLSK